MKIETFSRAVKGNCISISLCGGLQGSDPGARLQHSAGRKTGEWQGPDNGFEGQETNFQPLQELMFG